MTILFCLAACSCAVEPHASELQHPDVPAAKIEYFVQQPKGAGPWPTIVFLHGHQSRLKNIGGRAFVDWGVLRRFANEGYLAVSVSLPGYGNSTGPSDFAGRYSQNAVLAVINRLKNEQRAIPDRIAIQGTSLGAVTAALVAARDPDLAGLVLISGLYDLPAFFDHKGSIAALEVRLAAIGQTGGSHEALRSRSAFFMAERIKANTLILNGALDERTDASQAQHFAEKIIAGGGNATVHIYPNAGHDIPVADRDNLIATFIREALTP